MYHGLMKRLKLQLKRKHRLSGHLSKIHPKRTYFIRKKCEQRLVNQFKMLKEHPGSNMTIN